MAKSATFQSRSYMEDSCLVYFLRQSMVKIVLGFELPIWKRISKTADRIRRGEQ